MKLPFLKRRKAGSSSRARGGSRDKANPPSFRARTAVLVGVLGLAATGLLYRAVNLQLVDKAFLQGQGNQRFMRVAEIAAHRGTVTDRYGEPLAVSTPVDSIWVNPKELALAADQLPRLAKALKRDKNELARRVTSNLDRSFLYLVRHMQPADAAKIKALGIPGVYSVREYRRYYPSGEVAGHILGFTDVDDGGQEGLELAFDHWLAGEDGAKRVIQDNLGRTVQDVESIRPVRPGRDLTLSIDLRIQYLAYRELKAAIREHHAKAGSVVVLDVTTGEVLAMVNQPAYNPNDRDQLKPGGYRNRAATDIIEPGSSIKPFVVAAALASGKYSDRSVIDTSPGFYKVGIKIIEDKHNLGPVDIATILAKSSNVGMARIALALEPEQIYGTMTRLGFGQVTTSGYPGESAGLLSHYSHWRPIGIATMAYGYGLSVTPLQLAHAYATIGAGGVSRPISFLRVDQPVAGERVLDDRVGRQLVHMLESVITPDGTGMRASIPGYRVAGKTGTAWKSSAGGYSTDRYLAVFGGVAPATNPRLAAIVTVDEPTGGKFYGGDVAAPVFSGVVGGALRLLAVAPDAPIAPPVEDMPPGTLPTPGEPDAQSGALRDPVTAAVPSPAPGAVARR
ncbi:MAG: penicillin-binding transpeptidase domain-containing protein [Steroidobacteraceae bacterium]